MIARVLLVVSVVASEVRADDHALTVDEATQNAKHISEQVVASSYYVRFAGAFQNTAGGILGNAGLVRHNLFIEVGGGFQGTLTREAFAALASGDIGYMTNAGPAIVSVSAGVRVLHHDGATTFNEEAGVGRLVAEFPVLGASDVATGAFTQVMAVGLSLGLGAARASGDTSFYMEGAFCLSLYHDL